MQRRCKFPFRKRSPPYFLPVTESVSLKKESQPRVDPRPRSGLFVSFFSPLPTKYRLLLYNASIKPLFTYCCTVWSNCSQTNWDEWVNAIKFLTLVIFLSTCDYDCSLLSHFWVYIVFFQVFPLATPQALLCRTEAGAKRGDEPQETMRRRKKKAVSFPPSFARIFSWRETCAWRCAGITIPLGLNGLWELN